MTVLRDQIGVGVHEDGPYSDSDKVRADLLRLGIRRVRVRGTRLCGTPGLHVTVICWSADEAAAALKAGADAIEGPNEWNLVGGTGWPARVRQVQQAIWQTVGRQVPVYAPSPGARKDQKAFGDLTAYCDRASVHFYPGGDSLAHAATTLQAMLPQQRLITGQRPMRLTETGFTGAYPGHGGVTEAAAGQRVVPWITACLGLVDELDIYELYDQPGAGGKDRPWEQNFGLIRTPGGELKPAGVALQQFLADHGDGPLEAMQTVGALTAARDLSRQLVTVLG